MIAAAGEMTDSGAVASPRKCWFSAKIKGSGVVTHSQASAAIADRVLRLGTEGLVELRGR